MGVPSTSGTYTFNQAAASIVDGALRKCGAIASGETPTAQEMSDALTALNALVKHWMASGIHVWAEADATLFLQPGQIQYQLGLGSPDHATLAWTQLTVGTTAAGGATVIPMVSTAGVAVGDNIGICLDAGTIFWTTVATFSASSVTLAAALPSQASASEFAFDYTSALVRPLRVPGARRFIYQGAIENPIIPMSRLDYASLPDKTNLGAVTQFFFDPQIPYALMNVWPAPQDYSAALKFTAQMPLQDFDTVANVPGFPQEWLLALTWNLAMEIMLEYDVAPPRAQMIAQRAAETLSQCRQWDREPEPVYFGMAWNPTKRG